MKKKVKKIKKIKKIKQRRIKMPKKVEPKKVVKLAEPVKEHDNVISNPNETLAYEA